MTDLHIPFGRARAVRFDHYGDRDVLRVDDIELPTPGPGEVLVGVRAAGINPGEAAIRQGFLKSVASSTFPSGQGSDLAGVVLAVGPAAEISTADSPQLAVGDEVLGYSWTRSSHATHAVVPADQLIAKPADLSWEAAGSLYVVGATAWAAIEAVDPQPGEVVAVAGAAGGVGTLVTQLLVARGVRVLAIASAANADWLTGHGAEFVDYHGDLDTTLRAKADHIDAFIDLHGDPYLQLAVDLGIDVSRINTIIGFASAERLGTKAEGSVAGTRLDVLRELAAQIAGGDLELPIAATYPLDDVADAFAELETGHVRGKIALLPWPDPVPADDRDRDVTVISTDSEDARHLGLVGDTYTILIDGTQTAGAYTLIDMRIPAGGGPGPHRHDFEELFILLDGELEFTFRGTPRTVSAGEVINIPANAPHFFRNASEREARTLCLCTPAGQEEFFAAVADPLPSRTSEAPHLDGEALATRLALMARLAPAYRTELITQD